MRVKLTTWMIPDGPFLDIDGREYTYEELFSISSPDEAIAMGIPPLVVINFHGPWTSDDPDGQSPFLQYLRSLID